MSTIFRRFAAAMLGVVALATVVAAPASAAQVTRVILVPGQYVGATPFAPMAQNLTARGFPTTVLNLSGFDMRADAAAIGREVTKLRRSHPGDQIAIVGHSIGGVSGRLYLKEFPGATDKVATFVSIGSPQYGSPGACGQKAAPEVCPGTSFMRSLNKGDDTPGPTKYFSIRSAREWVTGDLDGGQCRVTPVPANESLPETGYEHTFEPLDPRIWDATATSLKGICAGRYVTTADGVLTYRKSALPGAPGYRP